MAGELFEVRGARANHERMALLLGVSRNTLSAWVAKEGFPVLRPGSKAQEAIYDTRAAFEWWGERELRRAGVSAADSGPMLNPVQQRARLDAARAEEVERRNLLLRRRMVLVEDAARVAEEQFGQVRSRLMEIPGRAAQELALITDPTAVERRLKDEIAAALEALNSDDVAA